MIKLMLIYTISVVLNFSQHLSDKNLRVNHHDCMWTITPAYLSSILAKRCLKFNFAKHTFYRRQYFNEKLKHKN